MLWTLAAFLLILSLVLVQFLKKVANKVKDAYIVYPSDALIDQALPQEIMEHMMTFLDPRAMIECRLVSKYWRHHAIKPSIEKAVTAHARHMVREVFNELNKQGMEITNGVIEQVLGYGITKDMFFVRASAIASKHGADLIVADPDLCAYIIGHNQWRQVKTDKKYFILTQAHKSAVPWRFSIPRCEFGTLPVFNKTSVEWGDIRMYQRHVADIVLDASTLPANYQDNARLYLYRPIKPVKYFYFVPLDDKFLYVLVYLFAPLIVHDALHSSYMPIIKGWFGQIVFIVSCTLQLILVQLFTRHLNTTSKEFKITLTTWISSYLLLTFIAYPASMTVFAGMGIQALMFVYAMICKEYFLPYGGTLSGKKRQAFVVGIVLILMMVDLKLVKESTRDLSILLTLFGNTVAYCVIVLHFIIMNFLGHISERGSFAWRYLFEWEPSTVRILKHCFSLVVLMTFVAPTWRGNHL